MQPRGSRLACTSDLVSPGTRFLDNRNPERQARHQALTDKLRGKLKRGGLGRNVVPVVAVLRVDTDFAAKSVGEPRGAGIGAKLRALKSNFTARVAAG